MCSDALQKEGSLGEEDEWKDGDVEFMVPVGPTGG